MPNILLQAASPLTNTVFILAMLAVFILFMVIPQRRKAKQQATFMDDLVKGRQVVTASGLIGHIDKIDGKIVHLNIGNKTPVRVTKNSISQELTDAYFPTTVD